MNSLHKYPVITLCGSTRFKKQFMEVQKRLTLEGNSVISVGLFGHSGDQEVWDGMDEGTLSKTKEMLDDMHKRKIDMILSILVYTFFSRMFDLMLPPALKHSIAVA